MVVMIPLALLWMHFIGDFLLQTDWMATNKSKSWGALAAHCFVYAFSVSAVAATLLGVPGGWFLVITFVTHFITDAVTSRITSRLWFIGLYPRPNEDLYRDEGELYYGGFTHYARMQGNRHWFFVVIGIDQLIHYVTLAWTYKLLS